MSALYNEIDPQNAAWLRELIARDLIAPGDVFEGDIRDLRASDLIGYTQFHAFAGIGVWSYALRLAGWPDDRPVWTGSCPCPPFSAAGKGQRCPQCGSSRNLCHPRKTGHFICLACGCDRHADDRHLWPEFARLIRECAHAVVFGEQVASADGRLWLGAVRADLETMGRAVGGADLCAAGVGAPHIRQRLWFVTESLADTGGQGLSLGSIADVGRRPLRDQGQATAESDLFSWLADTNIGIGGQGREIVARRDHRGHEVERTRFGGDGFGSRLADRAISELTERQGSRPGEAPGAGAFCQPERRGADAGTRRSGATNGFWRDADWLFCRDGSWRPVEPSTFPLVDGAPVRVGRLRGYGNAIVAQAAATVIRAYLEAESGRETVPPRTGSLNDFSELLG